MTTLDTRPYCANCGWQVGAPGDPDGGTQPDIGQNRRCDSCGGDLLLSGFSPPPAQPSVPALVAPPEDSTKAVLLQWLSYQDVFGVESLTKSELWSLIRDLLD